MRSIGFKAILFSCFILSIYSCNSLKNKTGVENERDWDEIDFSFTNGWDITYSIKLQANDKLIISPKTSDNTRHYFSTNLDKTRSSKLDTLLSTIDFSTIAKKKYWKSGDDLAAYDFIISKNNSSKELHVIGNAEPLEVESLFLLFDDIYNHYHFTSKDSIIFFKSDNIVFPPPVQKNILDTNNRLKNY